MGNQIYSSYAFKHDEAEKYKSNFERYQRLLSEYKVKRHDLKYDLVDGDDCNFDDYDIVIGRRPGYHHAVYKIHKNTPKLNMDELALICDLGSLCFGYVIVNDSIRVSED